MNDKKDDNQLPVCDWGGAVSEEELRATTMELPSLVEFHVAKEQQIAQGNMKGVFIDDAFGSIVNKNSDRPTVKLSDKDLDALRHHLGPGSF